MKNLIFLITLFAFISCQQVITTDFVIKKFNAKANSYKNIESEITRIDTFYDGYVMNRNGNILIEKDISDKLFGMSFYTIPNSINKEYLYDNDKAFEISKENKFYKVENGYYGFLGSPGGQLISKNLISLDTIYESVNLTEVNNNYKLSYSYKNDTIYNISNQKKVVFIDKHTFFPSKIIMTSEKLGEKSSQHFIFENIKIDNEIKVSIENYKNILQEFSIIQEDVVKRNTQLGKKFNVKNLSLITDNQAIDISTKFPAFISFWEVWCSPCIPSLPKIDELQNKYKKTINIIGITTDNQNTVLKVLVSKNITFLNVIGSNEIHKLYEINRFPTYFLVDKNGIIVKEYFSFSDEVEKDLNTLIRFLPSQE